MANHPVDIHVGKSLAYARKLRGLSMSAVAEALEDQITFQQIQKYENGSNRISASRLWMVSKVLKVHVSYFFEGLDNPKYTEPLIDDDSMRLLNKFRKLDQPNHRKLVMELVTMLQNNEHPADTNIKKLEKIQS